MAEAEGAPIRYSMRTDVGKVRAANEDAVIDLPEHQLWAVSDGMGGHKNGAYASQTVTAELGRLPATLPAGELMQSARDAVLRAHGEILEESARSGGATIGATVVILLISAGHFACLWAGDSRLYLFSDRQLQRVSRDHSLVADLVEAGHLTDEEAEHHPHSNVITRAVGVGEELEIDKRIGRVKPGDRFLLCSDGLTKYANDAVLAEVLATQPIENVAEHLVEFALEGGGADNISVIVVDVAEGDPMSGLMDDTERTVIPGPRPSGEH
ncbi:MAG: protein phosphatase 2C domain-containing protein [Pseudomonadota bacterium]